MYRSEVSFGIIMDVYVDILMLTNVYITYFFIKALQITIHRKYTALRVLTASLIGGISSMQILLSVGIAVSAGIKVITLLLISALLEGLNFKAIIKSCAVLISVNILFIGLCFLLWKFFNRAVIVIGVTVYFDISLLMLAVVTIITYSIFWLYDYLSFMNSAKRGAKVCVKIDSNEVMLNGICDTGNSLYDFFAQKPVIVCNSKDLEKAFCSKRFKLLPYKTVSGSGMIRVYTPKSVKIDNRTVEANIALTELGEPRAIYNPNILR